MTYTGVAHNNLTVNHNLNGFGTLCRPGMHKAQVALAFCCHNPFGPDEARALNDRAARRIARLEQLSPHRHGCVPAIRKEVQ